MKKIIFYSFFLLFCCLYLAPAQVTISYRDASGNLMSAEPIPTCGESKLYVRLDMVSNVNQIIVEINFPEGTSYVPGSLTKTGSSHHAIDIDVENIANLNRPQFRVTGPLSAGSMIAFNIERTANCRAYYLANIASPNVVQKDSVYCTYNGGSSKEEDPTVNFYNILAPIFTLVQPAPTSNATLNTPYSRTFSVKNGSLYSSDHIYLYLVHPGGDIRFDSLKIGSQLLTLNHKSGDTTFYLISNALLGSDSLFTNNEQIHFTEYFRLQKCSPSPTHYGIGWGCGGISVSNWCRKVTGTSIVNMASGVGDLATHSTQLDTGYVDMCGTGKGGYINMVDRFRWGGSGNAKAAAAYNVEAVMGQRTHGSSLLFSLPSYVEEIKEITVNGHPVPFTPFTASDRKIYVHLQDTLKFDPDGPGGLEDLDGDGYYDDLAPGSTLTLNYKMKINCNKVCNVQNPTIWRGGYIRHTKMCESTPKNSATRDSGYNIYESATINSYLPPNIEDGIPFSVRLSTTSFNNMNTNIFRNTKTRWQWMVILPPGLSVADSNFTWSFGYYPPTPSTVSQPIPFTQSGDTLFITSPDNRIGYITFNLEYDCAAGGNNNTPSLSYKFLQINNIETDCHCRELMLCVDNHTFFTHCPGPCVGPSTRLPTVRRTDNCLGWTNPQMTTRQHVDSISAYDLSKALFMDTIEIRGAAIQHGINSSKLNLRVEVNRFHNSLNILTPLQITYKIVRAGTIISQGVYSNFSDTASSGTTQRIDWSLTGALGGGQILIGDSIYTVSNRLCKNNNFINF